MTPSTATFTTTRSNTITTSSSSTSCRLRFEDGDEIGQQRPILSNLCLAIIGDSTSRQIYTALVRFLYSGEYELTPTTTTTKKNGNNTNQAVLSDDQNQQQPTVDTTVPTLVNGGYPSRKAYKEAIVSYFNDTLACDCHQPEGKYPTRKRLAKIWENMYYNNNNNIVTYVQKMGAHDAHGQWDPRRIYNNTEKKKNETSTSTTISTTTYLQEVSTQKYRPRKFAWHGNWEYVIRSHLAALTPKPRYVVLNAGFWGHDFFHDNNATLPAIRRALDDHDMIGIYKTTHKARGEKETDNSTSTTTVDSTLQPHDALGCLWMHHCWNLSWTGAVNDPSLYQDEIHFRSTMNGKFAAELLDLLRTISSSGAGSRQ
jgi:hypothetical protein